MGTDLSELKKLKAAYVEQKANEIIETMVRYEKLSHTMSTCDDPNWDRELHRAMSEIAKNLRSKGLKVTSSVNFEVTDWVITV